MRLNERQDKGGERRLQNRDMQAPHCAQEGCMSLRQKMIRVYQNVEVQVL